MHMSVEESIQVRLSKCYHEELNLRFSRSLVRKLVSISVLLTRFTQPLWVIPAENGPNYAGITR